MAGPSHHARGLAHTARAARSRPCSRPTPPLTLTRAVRCVARGAAQKVLFTVCASTELWYISLYMMHFTAGPTLALPASWGVAPIGLWRAACYASTPLFGFKQARAAATPDHPCNSLLFYHTHHD